MHSSVVLCRRGSLAWRAEFSVSKYVHNPQPKFHEIKLHFPHAYLGVDSSGNLVTLERMGGIRAVVRKLKENGISDQDFASHLVFLNEYFFRQMGSICPTQKLTKIIDLKGVSLSDARREVKLFFNRSNFELQQ